MGHNMVGAGHILWALFSIEDKSKPFIRNYLEHNMGVTKEMIFATFEKLTPDFKLILGKAPCTVKLKWQSERLLKAIQIARKI